MVRGVEPKDAKGLRKPSIKPGLAGQSEAATPKAIRVASGDQAASGQPLQQLRRHLRSIERCQVANSRHNPLVLRLNSQRVARFVIQTKGAATGTLPSPSSWSMTGLDSLEEVATSLKQATPAGNGSGSRELGERSNRSTSFPLTSQLDSST